MITESRKKVFEDFLNNSFNENIKNNEETYMKTSQWLKNVYYKYKNDTLPEEHKQSLEKRLKKRKITIDEFMETQGKLESLLSLSKMKKEVKTETIEDLEKLRDELEKNISCLKNKITKRNRALYRLTDEACEEIEKQVAELEEKSKEIAKKLSKSTSTKEETEEKTSDKAQKKIEELVTENRKKDSEIAALQNELAKQREERSFYSNKYKEEAERKLEIYKKELEEEFDKKLKTETTTHISKTNKKDIETKQQQKRIMLDLLLKGENLSLDDIKSHLKCHKIPISKLDIALNELRAEIPGIVKRIDNSGLLQNYTIGARATDRYKALKETTACPRISNILDGTIKFIIDPDPHIPLECTEDEMKQAREPFLQYSSSHNNIPIIGLGDYADTTKNINFERWRNMDQEAIEYSYKFYKNFAKTIAAAPKTKYYMTCGNHEKHSYLVGIDPVEIVNNNSDNILFLGMDKGQIMLGNDKIGLFHGIDTVPFSNRSTTKTQLKLDNYNQVCKEINSILNDNIYLLVAHYHQTVHNPVQNFSLVYGPMLCTAEIEDGHVTRMFIQELHTTKAGNNFIDDYYPCQIEIYNSNYQYKK